MIFISLQCFCHPGELDKSFNKNGKVTLLVGSTGSPANAIAIQPDQKILIAGSLYSGTHAGNDFLVADYRRGCIG